MTKKDKKPRPPMNFAEERLLESYRALTPEIRCIASAMMNILCAFELCYGEPPNNSISAKAEEIWNRPDNVIPFYRGNKAPDYNPAT